jgi:hypothetical protein
VLDTTSPLEVNVRVTGHEVMVVKVTTVVIDSVGRVVAATSAPVEVVTATSVLLETEAADTVTSVLLETEATDTVTSVLLETDAADTAVVDWQSKCTEWTPTSQGLEEPVGSFMVTAWAPAQAVLETVVPVALQEAVCLQIEPSPMVKCSSTSWSRSLVSCIELIVKAFPEVALIVGPESEEQVPMIFLG